MNPLTGLYAAATALRNRMYDRGQLTFRRLDRPVISVGNLSVGGSGKTPFVIALGKLLQSRGITFDVLSRGYGRKTSGVLQVKSDGNASDFGDEPLLIAQKLAVPVIVGESRCAAGQFAEQKFPSQLHILDDGFQHRSLYRDFDIVLLSANDLSDKLLPSGRLREPLSSLQRANAIVLPQDFSAPHQMIADFARHKKPVWKMHREITIPAPVTAPIVFCGIARPRQFFAQVRATGITPAAEIEFRDHHTYTETDIARLLTMAAKLNAGSFLTTEKDAINLGSLRDRLQPFSAAGLTITLDRLDDAVDAILTTIARSKPHS